MRSPLAHRRPSPALIVSILALVMATAGTATAAKVLITSSSQVKNGVITSADLRDGGVLGKDIRNGAVTLEKLAANAKPKTTSGGQTGGSQTNAFEVFRKDGPVTGEANKLQRVLTMNNLAPGVYAIFAKSILTSSGSDGGLFGQGQTTGGHCKLDAAGDVDESRVILGTPGANAPAGLSMQITRSFDKPSTVALDCEATTQWRATDSSIIAIRVESSPRTPSDG